MWMGTELKKLISNANDQMSNVRLIESVDGDGAGWSQWSKQTAKAHIPFVLLTPI